MSYSDPSTGAEPTFGRRRDTAAHKAPLRTAVFMAAWLALHGGAAAAGLPALISEAVNTDPAILEARANEDVAGSRAAASRAQHYPTVGVQAGGYVANPAGLNPPFRGLVGRLNVYAAGSIDTAIQRDELKQQSLQHKTSETRELVAMNVAQLFLEALRAKELMAVEQNNLERHEKIVGDLEVVVENDKGRRYELVQAQSRALQVRMRIVQYEKSMKLALSKLTRYTRQSATLENPIPSEWRQSLPDSAPARPHPSIETQRLEAEAVRAEQRTLQRQRLPRVDLEAGAGNQRYARMVLNWAFFDRSADFTVQSAAKQIAAAEQRTDLLQRDIDQRSATAEADMAQSLLQIKAAEQQIGASAKVVELYELQFKVGRRSLIELVNAHAELAGVEASRVIAANDYRQAVVNYLYANALLADWATARR